MGDDGLEHAHEDVCGQRPFVSLVKQYNLIKRQGLLSLEPGVYIFLFDPPPTPGGGQRYGQITGWGKKLLKGIKKGKNAYFFPN